MKLRNLIIVAAILATVPFFLTFLITREEEPMPREVTAIEPVEEPAGTSLPTKPEPARGSSPQPIPVKTEEAPAEKISEAGEADQPPQRQEAPETTPEAETVEPASPGVPAAVAAGEKSPGVDGEPSGQPMTVGVVKENAKLDPALAELAKNGVLAISSQNWEEARKIYLEMVQKAPDNALAYANLGVAEHQLGNRLAAAGNLRKSLDLNPGIAQNWQTLGVIHFERGELEMAISSLTRAIHEDPSNARSRLYLSAVVREYGWTEAAVTELERALETDPDLAEAHYNLAVTYLDEKPPRIELARRHYYAAVKLGAEPSSELEQVFQPRATPVPPE